MLNLSDSLYTYLIYSFHYFLFHANEYPFHTNHYTNISYFILIISALYLTSHLPHQRMKHCIIFAVFYFLMSLCFHLNHIQYIHLIFKPLIFIFIGFFKELKSRMIA